MARLLDDKQAAAFLRVERAEVRRMLQLGALPPSRLGGVMLVRERTSRITRQDAIARHVKSPGGAYRCPEALRRTR